jgi:hypothetical protein
MASLATKIHRAIAHKIPALTVRRVFAHGETYYEVRAREDPRRLSLLGTFSEHAKEHVFSLCKDVGYEIEEIVLGRTWLCRLEGERGR